MITVVTMVIGIARAWHCLHARWGFQVNRVPQMDRSLMTLETLCFKGNVVLFVPGVLVACISLRHACSAAPH